MPKERPDHHDAEIVIKLYDLRREAVMRASRDAINAKFTPRSYEDFLAITKPDHPHNAAFRQVSTYWEMVYGMARHEIVHAEYLVENSGEGMLLFAKVSPYLARFREEVSPRAFLSAEWAATHTQAGKRVLELFQSRLKAAASAAK
jgi:hypothetical protein